MPKHKNSYIKKLKTQNIYDEKEISDEKEIFDEKEISGDSCMLDLEMEPLLETPLLYNER